MLFASIVNTETDAQKRKQAAEALENMTAPNIYRTALSGDFNEVELMALRLWDTNDRGPASEVKDVEEL